MPGERYRIAAISATLFICATATCALNSAFGAILAWRMLNGSEPVSLAALVILGTTAAGAITALVVLRRPEVTLPRQDRPND